ncbi:MAG: hypothetical protein F6K36_01025 [Symploca sp. SIO3C6]|nr:hypothetical protein [Symploca sp. SIO3C6]
MGFKFKVYITTVRNDIYSSDKPQERPPKIIEIINNKKNRRVTEEGQTPRLMLTLRVLFLGLLARQAKQFIKEA